MAWNSIGKNDNAGSSSELVDLSGRKQIRLLLGEMPNGEPLSSWFYSISTPADDYRTWMSPKPEDDFFQTNRRVFGLRATHASLAYDYEDNAIKILESGNQVWEQIKALHEAGKDLNNRDILITKTGSGRGTEYKVVDLDPQPLTVDLANYQRPDIQARYVAPTRDSVMQDLRSLGFQNPEEIFQTKPVTLEEAKQAKMPFGKYRDKTLGEVFNIESEYLLFLATKIDREDIKQCARVISNNLLSTEFDVDGIAPSIDELTFSAPSAGGAAAATPAAPQAPAAPVQTDVQTHTDSAGNYYELHNNEWVLMTPPAPPAPPAPPVPPAPTTPPTPQAPPAAPQAPPAAPTPPPAPAAPQAPAAGGSDRNTMIQTINSTFEQKPEYKDFTKIIEAMKQATTPNEKTVINDFTDEEVQKLYALVVQ